MGTSQASSASPRMQGRRDSADTRCGEHLADLDRAPLARCAICRLDQRHRPDVVATRDLGLRARLDAAHQLRHRAGEGIGEPPLLPARRLPLAVAAADVVDRRRASGRVVGPPDGPFAMPLGPLDAPLDTAVRPACSSRRSRCSAGRPRTRGRRTPSPSSCAKSQLGSLRIEHMTALGSPNRKRNTSRWWIDMFRIAIRP